MNRKYSAIPQKWYSKNEISEKKNPLFFHFLYFRFLDDYSTDLGVRWRVGKDFLSEFDWFTILVGWMLPKTPKMMIEEYP